MVENKKVPTLTKTAGLKNTKRMRNEQIPVLTKNNPQYDMVYIIKPKNNV